MRTTEEVIRQHKHICWYPSAGVDFKPLLFLSEWYYKKNSVATDEGQAFPDLFIFSDYMGFHAHEMKLQVFGEAYEQIQNGFCNPDSCLIHVSYKNSSTEIMVKSFERLKDLNLPFDPELASMKNDIDYNSAILLNVEIVSRIHEEVNRYEVSVLYLAALNEFVAENILVPNGFKTEYLVIINYGTGFGGGCGKGFTWILSNYRKLGIKYLVSNHVVRGDIVNKDSEMPYPETKVIYYIDGVQWTKDSPVVWYTLT